MERLPLNSYVRMAHKSGRGEEGGIQCHKNSAIVSKKGSVVVASSSQTIHSGLQRLYKWGEYPLIGLQMCCNYGLIFREMRNHHSADVNDTCSFH